MTDFCQLAYCSLVSGTFNRSPGSSLISLVNVSRINNCRDGVTGALIASRTHFFQVLEGRFEKVMETMSRIRNDDRHEAVELLRVMPVPECEFGSWTLAVAELDLSKGPLTAEILARLHRGEREYLKAMHKLARDLVSRPVPLPMLAGNEVQFRPH